MGKDYLLLPLNVSTEFWCFLGVCAWPKAEKDGGGEPIAKKKKNER